MSLGNKHCLTFNHRWLELVNGYDLIYPFSRLFTLALIDSKFIFISVASCECECGCGIHCSYPRDCRDIQDTGFNISDTYLVYPVGVYTGIKVYCDMETDNGGWLVRLIFLR